MGIELIIACCVIAAVVALVIVFTLKSAHKTAKPQRAAANYIKQDSFKLTNQKDMFLYSRVTKIAKPQKKR
jgi:uncharacterized protein